MKKIRRSYYDRFAPVYDRFVAMHSGDLQEEVRRFFADRVPVREGDRVLDLCTGTGSLLPRLREKTGPRGLVAGIDFSPGMLRVNREKTRPCSNIGLVRGDVARLPFASQVFDAVTCTHAFYELESGAQLSMLGEIRRVLKPGASFLMMEHDVPRSPFVRFLFYIRLLSMGLGKARAILKHEGDLLQSRFPRVERLSTPSGRSKIWICRKGGHA